jgi:hypothetical protein
MGQKRQKAHTPTLLNKLCLPNRTSTGLLQLSFSCAVETQHYFGAVLVGARLAGNPSTDIQ